MAKMTRQRLLAENLQLRAQLAAAQPESRQSLRNKLTKVLAENKTLQAQVDVLKPSKPAA